MDYSSQEQSKAIDLLHSTAIALRSVFARDATYARLV
jgi:hypothetical protein